MVLQLLIYQLYSVLLEVNHSCPLYCLTKDAMLIAHQQIPNVTVMSSSTKISSCSPLKSMFSTIDYLSFRIRNSNSNPSSMYCLLSYRRCLVHCPPVDPLRTSDVIFHQNCIMFTPQVDILYNKNTSPIPFKTPTQIHLVHALSFCQRNNQCVLLQDMFATWQTFMMALLLPSANKSKNTSTCPCLPRNLVAKVLFPQVA